jgi:hypothetical protein
MRSANTARNSLRIVAFLNDEGNVEQARDMSYPRIEVMHAETDEQVVIFVPKQLNLAVVLLYYRADPNLFRQEVGRPATSRRAADEVHPVARLGEQLGDFTGNLFGTTLTDEETWDKDGDLELSSGGE